MGSLPLAFTAPAVLFGLVLLAAIWFLLRLVPPRPREVSFPPTRLLLDSPDQEETPARTPWWLTLLRLLLAALIILALAGPIWRPLAEGPVSRGPLAIVMDNGWGSANHWERAVATANALIDGAESSGRPVALVATAEGTQQAFTPAPASEAREKLRALEPRPWAPDRGALREGLAGLADLASEFVWLGDRVAGPTDAPFLEFLTGLPEATALSVYQPRDSDATALVASRNDTEQMTVEVARAVAGPSAPRFVSALDEKGRAIGTADFTFAADATRAEAVFDLPIELRNQIARLEISDKSSAGEIFFLDERWRRRTVGLLAGTSFDFSQPLLSPLHYLSKALNPFADVRIPQASEIGAAAKELIDQNVSVIVMADIGTIVGDGTERLEKWVENGGVLVRFAGPRLAAGTEDLLPVRLRSGERALGGNLSWQEPQPIGQFSENTPFAGIKVTDEVTVTRQLLAEPDAELPEKTWASLADGTPLVTAGQSGRGWLVLFHVTADTTWSNLPLSGTFVEMLRKIVAFSHATVSPATGSNDRQTTLPPMKLVDGRGEIGAPTRDAKGIFESELAELQASRDHPPGLYGTEDGFRALNLFHDGAVPTALEAAVLGARAQMRTYAASEPVSLKPWLLLAALVLLLADSLVMIFIRGVPRFLRPRHAGAVLAGLAVLSLTPTDAVRAQSAANAPDQFALESALRTRLAFVMTGDVEADEKARNGLFGLSLYLAERTALEPGDPIGVNIDEDELAFFPLIYWPVGADAEMPSERGLARIDSFMKNGGTVIFDTGDQLSGSASGLEAGTPEGERLKLILGRLDVPPLEPVPPDHVLTKAFYLLQDFPGRWTGSPLWVERLQAPESGDRPVRRSDGVSPIMITGNDFAGAWAMTAEGDFVYPTVPDNQRQRELAFRVGVNIVMYTLTGNYKADQVHVPALLERLGQ